MQTTIPERVLRSRIRAAYRVRATSAAVCAGATVYALGAGAAMSLCLNAAYIAALAALPAGALAAFFAHKALMRRRAPQPRALDRARCAVLCATLLALALFAFAALISLTKEALLPLARISFIAQASFLFAALCCAGGAQGASRLTFGLRLIVIAGIVALCIRTLSFETMAGLFPLLGTGARQTALAALCMAAGGVPALLIALPPPELLELDEDMRLSATPGAWFFVWRVLAGCVFAVALLAALSLCNTYESIAAQYAWGRRMIVMCQNEPHEGLAQTALMLLQALCLLLCAVHALLGAAQALQGALPRAGRWALWACLLAGAALLTALVFAGIDLALYAAPFLSVPAAAVCALSLGKGEKP